MEIPRLNRFVPDENLVWKRKDDWVTQKDEIPQNEIIEEGDIIKTLSITNKLGVWSYPMIVNKVWQTLFLQLNKEFIYKKLKISKPKFDVLCSCASLSQAENNTKLSENFLETDISVNSSSENYDISFRFKLGKGSSKTNLVWNIALHVNQFSLKLIDQIFVFSHKHQISSKEGLIHLHSGYVCKALEKIWWFKTDLLDNRPRPSKKRLQEEIISEEECDSVENKKPNILSISNKIEESLRCIGDLQTERSIIDYKIEQEKKNLRRLEKKNDEKQEEDLSQLQILFADSTGKEGENFDFFNLEEN